MTSRPSPFRPVPSQLDLPALDAHVLQRWRDERVFERSLEQTAGGEPFTVFEGPPTANGHPGTHHIEARVFKDVFPRFRTMQGRSVPRRAGWDCHGLPVELAVEKELGFTGKGDIEAYGVAEFNARCRESVLRHVDEFERLTQRMGYWVDLDAAYRTMDTSYVESVWWSLAQIHAQGLLVEDYRVTPYCPRCQTGLSDHEVAQGYTDLVDPSVYVRLRLLPTDDDPDPADLLVWTTTPWTLPSNTAVAVHPELTYARVRTDGRDVWVAAELVEAALGADAEVLATTTGAALERRRYTPPFDLVAIPDAHYVVLADYVSTDEGTGLVHQAPAFGAEDLQVARAYGLPVVNPVRTDGTFAPDVPLVGGVFFKAADEALMADLRARGLLLRHRPYEHSYPLCWRCDTALLYYALPSWYVRTTAVRDALLRENAATDWHPETIRTGRYGEWLRNNVDWALSRSRFWGTPLPLWRCSADAAHVTAVESLAHLSRLTGTDQSGLDPHRPFIDAVTFACPEAGCGAGARRVPEVIDAWYDSGAMPFAQWGYPHVDGSAERFEAAYPADMVCEALDQTRGWFYTLMAVGTTVFDRSSYRTVLCLGLILDDAGRKMSKHLGNVLDPFELMDRHGADAVRWLMLTGGNPWQPRRVGHEAVGEVVRTVLLTYWNTVSFFTTYAAAAGWAPPSVNEVDEAHAEAGLDSWVVAELDDTVREVTAALTAYDSPRAGRRLQRFLDDLSNWYVRRSRRRFWDGDEAALLTLWRALDTVTRLLAPFVPFLTDEVARVLGGEQASVHLMSWPTAAPVTPEEDELRAQVARVRRLVELGRAARASSKVKTRQPLARALVSGADGIDARLLRELAEELNVGSVQPLSGAGELVDVAVKPNFRALGRRFGNRTKEVAAQFTAAAYLDGVVRVTLDGEEIELSGDELLVTETPREGWAVSAGEGVSVALDLTLTPELVRAGLLRDVVRAVQDARKATGLEVTDRIELWWTAPEGSELATALREGADVPAREVLAPTVTEGEPPVEVRGWVDAATGLRFWLRAAGA